MAIPGGGQDPPAPGAVKTAAGPAFAHEGAGGAPAPQPFAPDALGFRPPARPVGPAR